MLFLIILHKNGLDKCILSGRCFCYSVDFVQCFQSSLTCESADMLSKFKVRQRMIISLIKKAIRPNMKFARWRRKDRWTRHICVSPPDGRYTRTPYNECHVISNQQQLDCMFNSCFGLTTKETSMLCLINPLWGEFIGDSFTNGHSTQAQSTSCHDHHYGHYKIWCHAYTGLYLGC